MYIPHQLPIHLLVSYYNKTPQRIVYSSSPYLLLFSLKIYFNQTFPPSLFHPTTLLKVTSYLHIFKLSVQSSIFLLFDLTVVIDALHHPFLLKTLSSVGFQDTTLSWFPSSLTDWSSQVSLACSYFPHLQNLVGPRAQFLDLFFSLYSLS